ncbi:MAG: alpha/beta hydrolase [Acidimicrobiales bacterium]
MRRRLTAVFFVAALVLTACGDDTPTLAEIDETTTTSTASDDSTTTADRQSESVNGFEPEPLDFESCGAGMECATLDVPLDWDEPGGRTIELAVARVPADPDERIGALVFNPGGPGAPAVSSLAFQPFDPDLADRFDIVAWDPRGIGESTAIECGAAAEPFLRLDNDPDSPEEQAALDAAAEAVAGECADEDSELLPHVGTDDVARDLEAIRIAMGVPLAYYGFSYGTFIGQRYAELFPEGARSIVLDGVVDPSQALPDLLRAQAQGFQDTIEAVFADCPAGRSDCPEGGAEAAYDRVMAEVETTPLPTDDGSGLGPSDVSTAATRVAYDPGSWRLLYAALEEADEGGDGTALLQLAEQYRGFGSFGAYQAVSCLDSPHPEGGEAWTAFAAELEAISPRFGSAIANEMRPCAYWPTPSEPVNGPVVAAGSPPILVIGTTGDAATPFANAERVADELANGHLLTHEGDGHTAYSFSGCVRDAVADYLINGTLPEPGARCR